MFKDVPKDLPTNDPVSLLLMQMDRFGIEKSVIGVGEPSATLALKTYPDRFVPSGNLSDPNDVMGSVNIIRRDYEQYGIRATSVFPSGTFPQVAIDDPKMYPIYATCVELGIPIFVCAGVPGPRRAWLALGPCPAPDAGLLRFMEFLLPVVTQYLQSALEVEHAANELAERYEEINLLYTISEILGRTVSLDEATKTILIEVSETVGARRATVLVHDHESNTLKAVAARGVDLASVPPIELDDPCSVSARVFRTQHPILAEANEMICAQETSYRRGEMLSVPITWTAPAPRGAEPLGVVNLSDRRSGQPFTAGDQKLIAAIATQIGTAIQNTRLVRASVEQQRLAHEMQLAHDLQMKLLPNNAIVAPEISRASNSAVRSASL